MKPTTDPVLTAREMRGAEERLMAGGATARTLMEIAGREAADWVWRAAAGRSVTVLCGPGNNGGDGFVIARVLQERGLPVEVIAPLDTGAQAAGEARAAYAGPIVESADNAVLVDCLFGTGLSRPLGGDLTGLLRDLAQRHAYRIAVDLPSGVESDAGRMLDEDLPDYHLTIALGAWKRSHWLMPAAARMGERRLVDLGIGEVAGAARLSTTPQVSPPPASAHKYSRGLLAVVGGAMPGAAMLAARAAMRAGAGYVKLLADYKSPMTPDELVVDDSALEESLSDERIDAVAIGPGLGRDAAARGRLLTALARADRLVLDADALMLLRPGDIEDGQEVLLTPHGGELDALCQAFGVEASDRIERALAVHRLAGCAILAKGPDNVLIDQDGQITLFPPAPSWLSTAGTGDVLSGIAASRMATGKNAGDAAEEAVWLHTLAARMTPAPFCSGDLIRYIPIAYEHFL
ncbi:NAD(P)H-hydrate dehydratase [Aurantiacibacter spongiae]|uniref:Bifunctional NAD(P)H-hydrate repair enzyme n=1 Tax=Aurantiacibacter spongiae TaxID=2488860 RepID=A0A3N5CIT1_9SPHN|nr:NAD(P)H-hydrate dehydratase [Aurantiacibacter spongiae]RPF68834.1 NAD(P)H-hydrate dehydratase [Aurantiacibacter spongiae]